MSMPSKPAPWKYKYFKPEDFGEFLNLMHPGLLQVLDDFRENWGKPVMISPAPGAIGRTDGTSFHNYVAHEKVMAIDLMPLGMKTRTDFVRAFEAAKKAGALGFGIYPDWKPQPGVHIDIGIRKGRGINNPATWAGIRQKSTGKQIYVAMSEAL